MGQVEACCGARDKPPKPEEAPALLEYNVEEYVGIDELRKDRTVRESRHKRSSKRNHGEKKRKRRRAGHDDGKRRSGGSKRDGSRKHRSSRRAREGDANHSMDRNGLPGSRRREGSRGGSGSPSDGNGVGPGDLAADMEAAANGTHALSNGNSFPRNNRARTESGGEEEDGEMDESDTESSDTAEAGDAAPVPPIKEDDFRELLAQESSDSSQWQRLHGSKDSSFSVFLREVDGDSPTVLRTRVYYFFRDHSAEQVFNFLFDHEARLSWDKAFLELREVEELPDGSTVIYSRYQAPAPGTKEQDFVDYRKAVQLKDGAYAVVFLPAEHTACPVYPEYTRCRTLFSGNLVRDAASVPAVVRDIMPPDTRTVLMTLGQSEAKSPVPSFVIRMLKWSVKKVVVQSSKDWGDEFTKAMKQHV